jgi:type IV pilus assembly protein PilB
MSHKIINRLFSYTNQEGASDLVITDQAQQTSVDYLFPGGTKQSFYLPKNLEQNLTASLRQILAISPGELPAQKYCKITAKDYRLTFHLTILPNKTGEKVIINIINKPDKLWRLSQLGLKTADLKTLKAALKIRAGLIIVSSPPNQGKSATLYSLLAELDNQGRSTYLLSKNPEQEISGVNSLPLTETNWEKILQHDSEIIAIDDLNEDWMFEKAFRSAATGRLVIIAIAASGQREILDKISQIKLPLKLKADTLKIIINQRLVDLKRQKEKIARGQRQTIGAFEISHL